MEQFKVIALFPIYFVVLGAPAFFIIFLYFFSIYLIVSTVSFLEVSENALLPTLIRSVDFKMNLFRVPSP